MIFSFHFSDIVGIYIIIVVQLYYHNKQMNAKISFFSLLSVFFSYNHSMLDILQKYSIRAKKHLGQNFLLDENILQKIADIIPLE